MTPSIVTAAYIIGYRSVYCTVLYCNPSWICLCYRCACHGSISSYCLPFCV